MQSEASDLEGFVSDIHRALETGYWHDRTAWTSPGSLDAIGRTESEVRASLTALSQVYSAAWAREQMQETVSLAEAQAADPALHEAIRELVGTPRSDAKSLAERFQAAQTLARPSHPLFPYLFESAGISIVSYVHELAESVERLDKKGLLGDLRRRLREPTEFEGAHEEVIALRHWLDAGAQITKNVPSGIGNRNCEWKVTDGKVSICGEVKCIDLAPVNRRIAEAFAAGEDPKPYDLEAEGDKIMDVVCDHACQLPKDVPGLMVVSGRDRAGSLPFSAGAARRIEDRFRGSIDCRHIGGVLVLRAFQVPEVGLTRFALFVKNPQGPDLDLPLIRRGFPLLQVWDREKFS